MNFSTDSLRGLLGTNGLASPSRWMVVLPQISGKTKVSGGGVGEYNANDLNILCTNARIPQKTVRTIERQMGAVSTKAAVGFEPGEANFSFYLTHDYMVRKYFQDWMDCVVSDQPPFEVGFFDEYKADILVEQLDKKGNFVYITKLIDCYPTNIAEIELNNAAQQAALELVVTIAFKNYEAT